MKNPAMVPVIVDMSCWDCIQMQPVESCLTDLLDLASPPTISPWCTFVFCSLLLRRQCSHPGEVYQLAEVAHTQKHRASGTR